MINKAYLGISGGLLLCLSGCSSTIHKPFTIDGNRAKSVSIDAKQRAILVTYDRGNEGKGYWHVVCAEPSPDAMVAAAASIAGNVKVPGQADVGISEAISETAAKIGLRTHTIQLLRDGLYRACEAFMNNAISPAEYQLILRGYDDAMVTLLAIESITGVASPNTVIIAAGEGEAREQAGQGSGGGTPDNGTPAPADDRSPSGTDDSGEGVRTTGAKAVSGTSMLGQQTTVQVSDKVAEIVYKIFERYLQHQIALIEKSPLTKQAKNAPMPGPGK